MRPMSEPTTFGLAGRLQGARQLFNEYPRQFWILVAAMFIDRLGGALLFPFFSLYITKKFNVGMTEVGILFGVFAGTGLISSLMGGALTDRMGRKGILIFGLVMSALSAVLMGLMDSFVPFIIVTVVVGLLADVGFPAQQAMVADLLTDEKRAQGFGILRVVANLAVTFGPMIGGLLAARSYLLLFIIDAITSMITAGVVYFALQETRAAPKEDAPQETIGQTFAGYFRVLKDSAFTWFIVASMLMVLVYMQMNTTLGVYLRDVHGISEQAYGYILSLNAAMVVLFQFPITRRIVRYRPMSVMVVGTLLYAIGFGMYGFVSLYIFFLLAMAIITIGEMLVSPVSQAIVARLAPEDMRGRYMATYGFSWVIPSAIGPLLAGLTMDYIDPRWVWYAAGLLGVIAAGAYYYLEVRTGSARWAVIDERLRIIEQLEDGAITAEEAANLLERVDEGRWAKLAPTLPAEQKRHIRIRVSEMATGNMKSDLRLPVGLVNTILYTSGRLSADLEEFDHDRLRELISSSTAGNQPQSMAAGDQTKIDITLE
jgi:MFS family permease